jgi:Rrf2 family transcriptional regulator, iron-sulfur cluster assembly transcription factor
VLAVLGSRLFEGEFCEKHAGTEDTCTHCDQLLDPLAVELRAKVVDQLLSKTTIQDLVRNEKEMDTFMSNLVVLSAASDMKSNPVPVRG